MAWIRTVKEEDADGELNRIYGRIRGTRGRTSNIFLSQSLNPSALEAHLDLYLRVMFGKSKITRAQREMIAVVVSTANDCEYCVVHHSAALRRHVMDDELVKHLAKDFEGARLEAKDKDMLQYAVKLTMRPASISQHDLERLKKDALPTRRFSISLS